MKYALLYKLQAKGRAYQEVQLGGVHTRVHNIRVPSIHIPDILPCDAGKMPHVQ